MLGVPLPDATQWELIEKVGDSGHVVLRYLEGLAAQGEVIYQDDTTVRILSLVQENQRVEARAETLGRLRSSSHRMGRSFCWRSCAAGMRITFLLP
jgi:hypothetical protein